MDYRLPVGIGLLIVMAPEQYLKIIWEILDVNYRLRVDIVLRNFNAIPVA